VRVFVNATLAGTVYDGLMASVGETNRKKFKPTFFGAVLFNDPRVLAKGRVSPAVRRLAAVFEATYPTVWAFVLHKKKHQYENLAREMQRKESDFVIGTVCERLRKHHPDVAFVTVHDAIMAPAQHIQTVARVIKEEFVRRLGVSPAVAVDPTSR
jgi:hypothetical protein